MAATASRGRSAGAEVVRFQVGQHLPGSFQHFWGNASEPGDVNPVALVGAARSDLMKKDDVV